MQSRGDADMKGKEKNIVLCLLGLRSTTAKGAAYETKQFWDVC